jgi:hypothetical protein
MLSFTKQIMQFSFVNLIYVGAAEIVHAFFLACYLKFGKFGGGGVAVFF